MGWTATFVAGAVALFLLLLAAALHRRGGIGRLSLVPWDYLLLLAAIALLAIAAHGVSLWRAGWPLPWV